MLNDEQRKKLEKARTELTRVGLYGSEDLLFKSIENVISKLNEVLNEGQ